MREVLVPRMGESIAEASVAKIVKNVGDSVREDELLFELETDKAVVEVSAPVSGILKETRVEVGQSVVVNDVLALIDENVPLSNDGGPSLTDITGDMIPPVAIASSFSESVGDGRRGFPSDTGATTSSVKSKSPVLYSKQNAPSAKTLIANSSLSSGDITGTGKDARITKADVLEQLFSAKSMQGAVNPVVKSSSKLSLMGEGDSVSQFPRRIVPMSKLRQRIASRLKESQNTAAMLTTFNEVDMQNVIQMRKRYKDLFEKVHGLKLGFMSFFVQAVIRGLEEFPEINAEIRGSNIVYKDYYNLGVAVGSKNGLVVPVIKNAQTLSFAEIEKRILEYAKKARDGKIEPDDMQDGTFTISNGGVYGSLMSTPIINPPQSAILGMHAIKERPVVASGQIVIRPMMYLALSYDHRIVDGKEAVSFLVRIKESVEDPERLLLRV